MTKRLEVELKRDGCEVSGKVLHQDENLTNTSAKDDEYKLICKFGSYEIRSWNVPEVDEFILYIGGNNNGYYNFYNDYYFHEEQEAQDYIDAMEKMVEYINSDDFEIGKDISDIDLKYDFGKIIEQFGKMKEMSDSINDFSNKMAELTKEMPTFEEANKRMTELNVKDMEVELTKQSLLKNSDAEYDDKSYEFKIGKVVRIDDKNTQKQKENKFEYNIYEEDITPLFTGDTEYNKTEHIINELFYTIRDNDVDDEIKDWCKLQIEKILKGE